MGHSLFLNKKKIDLGDVSIVRKIRIADVFNVSERKSSFSYTIRLPRTANNIQILDMLGVEGNTSRKPYESVRADYVVDDISIVENGYAVVRSEKFEINIFDGIISLGSLFGDKLMSDLPLEDLNHELTVNNYIDSFNNEKGFIYANADFGRGAGEFKSFEEVGGNVPIPLSEVFTVNIEKQAPSVFVHTLFRRLFESNGLNLIGDFFNEDEDYLKELIAPSLGYEVDLYGLENTKIARYRSGKNKGSFNLEDAVLGGESIFSLNEKESNGDFEVDENGYLEVNKSGVYRFDISIELERSITGVDSSYEVFINGSNAGLGAYLYEDLTEERVVITLVEGDVVSFRYYSFQGADISDDDDDEVDNNYEYVARISFDINVQGGMQIVKPVDYLPKIKQLDFFKDVVERYGLILHPISGSDDFEFKQIEKVLQDKESAEDWTEKLTYKKGESYSSGYAKVNKGTYKYANEDDEEGEGYNGFFKVDDENADYTNEVIKSSFTIPAKSEFDEDVDVYSLPIWKDEKKVRVKFFQELIEVERIENRALELTSDRIDVDGVFSEESYFEGGVIFKSGYVVKKYKVSDLNNAVVGYASGTMENFLEPVALKVDSEGIIKAFASSSGINRWEKDNSFYNQVAGEEVNDFFNVEFIYLLGSIDFEPFIFYADTVERNTAENDKVDASVMSLKKVNKSVLIRKFDTGDYVNFNGEFPELSLDNISMQYLLNKNYPSFVLLMNDFKKRTLEVNLTTTDIYNLNFFRLKYFKQLGRYFYLNSVTHKKDKDSEVEVLEINNFL